MEDVLKETMRPRALKHFADDLAGSSKAHKVQESAVVEKGVGVVVVVVGRGWGVTTARVHAHQSPEEPRRCTMRPCLISAHTSWDG